MTAPSDDPAFEAKLVAASKILVPAAAGLGAGVAGMAATAAVLALLRSPGAAWSDDSRLVGLLTALSLAGNLAAGFAADILWKARLRAAAPRCADALTAAFVLRVVPREAAAMLGGVAAVLGAQSGLLRARPVYWLSLAPAALFLNFLREVWPSPRNLRDELEKIVR